MTESNPEPTTAPKLEKKNLRIAYRAFHGVVSRWKTICGDAARFASLVGPDRLISISQSCDSGEGIVTVWYWSDRQTDWERPPMGTMRDRVVAAPADPKAPQKPDPK